MTVRSLPTWLLEARTGAGARPSAPTPPEAAQAGELWLIGNVAGERALVAIVLLDDRVVFLARRHRGPRLLLSIALCTEPDIATDQSLAYSAAETGAPYPVLVHTDLCGPIERTQLITRIGALPGSIDALARATEWGDFAPALDGRRGLPLAGPHDTRIAVLDAEAERLWRFLAGDGLD